MPKLAWKIVGSAALLALLGAGTYYIWSEWHALVLPLFRELLVRLLLIEWVAAGLVFLRNFAWRFGGKKILYFLWFILLLPLIPPIVRKAFRAKKENLKKIAGERIIAAKSWWSHANWLIKVLIGAFVFLIFIFLGFSAGTALGILAILPIPIKMPIILSGFMQKRIIPFLARMAAGRGLDKLFPSFKKYLPRSAILLYTKLWVTTMRGLIGKRREFLKGYMERRMKMEEKNWS